MERRENSEFVNETQSEKIEKLKKKYNIRECYVQLGRYISFFLLNQ